MPGTGTLVQVIIPNPLFNMWKQHAMGGDLPEPDLEGFVSISEVVWRKGLIEERLVFFLQRLQSHCLPFAMIGTMSLMFVGFALFPLTSCPKL